MAQAITSPHGNTFRLFRGIPANLGGAASIAANNVLVTASRNDPWIRAASTDGSSVTAMTPAFTRATVNVAFDFYLCGGNGSPVPGDCVEIIIPVSTTNGATGVSNGASLLLDEPIDTALLASGGALVQAGRRIIAKASTSTGRVTGSIVLSSNVDTPVIVRYRHIITSATILVAAT